MSRAKNFRRAKSEWRSAIHPGPPGPGFAKIAGATFPQPRLPLPNQRSRSVIRRRGGTPGPPAFPLSGGRCRAQRGGCGCLPGPHHFHACPTVPRPSGIPPPDGASPPPSNLWRQLSLYSGCSHQSNRSSFRSRYWSIRFHGMPFEAFLPP